MPMLVAPMLVAPMLVAPMLVAPRVVADLRWTAPEVIDADGVEPWTQLPIWLPPGPADAGRPEGGRADGGRSEAASP